MFNTTGHVTKPNMGYTVIHPAAKELLVKLILYIHPEELANMIGIHPRTIKRACALYEATGEVVQRNPNVGRSRALKFEHIEVSS